jgi:hypothetical protein
VTDDTERMYRPGAVIGSAGADIARRTYPMLGPWAEAPLLQAGDPVLWDGDPYKVVGSIVSGLTRRIRLRSERQARVEAEVRRILDEVAAEWRRALPDPRRRWWPGR